MNGLLGARRSARALLSLLLQLAGGAAALRANETPLTPEEELRTFRVEAPLQVELVAAEPRVESPCAMAFDREGRLFVAENRGYPHTTEPFQGRIVLLESTRRDGHFDRRTIFADGLTFPNGVMPWQDGLIVTCAPDILFFRDSTGSGHADEKRVLLTGFDAAKSTQLRVNCPTLGPDGWIYFAAGLVGGTITAPEHPEMPPVKMTGDLRWNPRTGAFENVDGRAQYGLAFDDFGQRFICMNRLPVQHVVLASRWLHRNPRLAFGETVQDCNDRTVKTGLKGGGDGVRVWPISANITTADSHAGSFTAACGVKIWRGGALPDSYNGCALSCEPTGNLIHADRLVPRGATFSAEAMLPRREVFASSDDWCRPVFLTSGPDGALYVCDMYRRVIEHPDYLPAEIRKHSDFEAGKAMGRIWRISEPARRKAWPPAGETKEEQLPPLLQEPNGWMRGVAFQRLLEKASEVHTAAELEASLASPSMAAGQAAALFALDVVRGLTTAQFATALHSPHAGVRKAALILAADRAGTVLELLGAGALPLDDPDTQVRAFCAIALGAGAEPGGQARDSTQILDALAKIAARAPSDRWTRAAVLSSAAGSEWRLAKALLPLLDSAAPGALDLLRALGATAPGDFEEEQLAATPAVLRLSLIAGMADARNLPLEDAAATGWKQKAIGDAVRALHQGQNVPGERLAAVAVLRHASWPTAGPVLLEEVDRGIDPELRTAAIRALAGFDAVEVSDRLLAPQRWSAMAAEERETVLTALLARPVHLPRVLAAVESGAIPANAISPAQRAALARNKDTDLRERAAKLFGAPASGDRARAYEAAKAVLALNPNAAHGREVFKTACASCHRLDREGHQVGPDLLDIRSQPKESILLHIVVPDFEIAPGFAASIVELKDGRSLAGIVIAESPEAVTLRMPLGVEETLARSNVSSLKVSEHSLMPPGLEAAMSPQDLADLLAFLKGES